MGKINVPFRHDFVGSFLRPEKLKQARKDYESKKNFKRRIDTNRR